MSDNQENRVEEIADRNRIRELVTLAKTSREIVEVRVKDHSGRFFTYFLDAPPEEKLSGWIVAPLEPAVGNGKMRLCPDITVAFSHHTQYYAAETRYIGAIMRPELSLVQLAFPDKLKVYPLRKNSRVSMPENFDMVVEVIRKRTMLFAGQVLDFSEGGMLFENTASKEDTPKVGDILELLVYPPQSSRLEPFQMLAEVARLLEVRKKTGAGSREMIGVRFLKFTPHAEKVATYLRKLYGVEEPKKSGGGWWPL